MDEHPKVDQFNRSLERIFQSQSPGRGNLTVEDRRALGFVKRALEIDLSKQSKTRERLRHHLEEMAILQLPRGHKFSLKILFKPRGLSWIGLVVLVQIAIGLIFGSMSANTHTPTLLESMGCVTPPTESIWSQKTDVNPTWSTGQKSTEAGSLQLMDNPRPIPTPLAPYAGLASLSDTSFPSATPWLTRSPVEP